MSVIANDTCLNIVNFLLLPNLTYQSGVIANVINYENGKNHGHATTYFENGNVQTEGDFINNAKEGKWSWYYENGTLESTVSYSKDKKTGTQVLSWGATDSGSLPTDFSKFYAKQQHFNIFLISTINLVVRITHHLNPQQLPDVTQLP